MIEERKIANALGRALKRANMAVRAAQGAVVALVNSGLHPKDEARARKRMAALVAKAAALRKAAATACRRARNKETPKPKRPPAVRTRVAIATIECVKSRCDIEDDGCWTWTRGVNADGFAVARIGPTPSVSVRRFVANETFGREAMIGRSAVMKCGNRLCLNPGHMVKSTHSKVLMASHRAGRMFGPSHRARLTKAVRARPTTKLTAEKVAEIRGLKGSVLREDVAIRFGVSRSAISKIWNNKLWRATSVAASVFSQGGV